MILFKFSFLTVCYLTQPTAAEFRIMKNFAAENNNCAIWKQEKFQELACTSGGTSILYDFSCYRTLEPKRK